MPWIPTSRKAARNGIRSCGSSGASGSSGGGSVASMSRPPSRASRSCAGSSSRRQNAHCQALDLRLDETVRAVPPAVDDVDVQRLGVLEDEEVVAQQLQLEHGLLRAHRLDWKALRLDDP